jgi:hypothetical protein
MAESLGGSGSSAAFPLSSVSVKQDYAYQAYRILQVAFILAPIIAGVDKFFNDLTNWEMYLSPALASQLHIAVMPLMKTIGVIEIVAGIVVAAWPRLGAYIVTVWLWAIIVNLLTLHGFYDIALRDFGLSLAALALARLSQQFDSPKRAN